MCCSTRATQTPSSTTSNITTPQIRVGVDSVGQLRLAMMPLMIVHCFPYNCRFYDLDIFYVRGDEVQYSIYCPNPHYRPSTPLTINITQSHSPTKSPVVVQRDDPLRC
eukprot:m.170645 g.170645  ORF g.170645 m.170645 type:complete len:108 (-) comp53259_c0_seq6:12-335(-)